MLLNLLLGIVLGVFLSFVALCVFYYYTVIYKGRKLIAKSSFSLVWNKPLVLKPMMCFYDVLNTSPSSGNFQYLIVLDKNVVYLDVHSKTTISVPQEDNVISIKSMELVNRPYRKPRKGSK